MAHNGKGYDHYLLLNYLLEDDITPSAIPQGSTMLYIFHETYKQRLIDLLSFIPMRLVQMPKPFGSRSIFMYYPHEVVFEGVPDDNF